MKKTFFQNYLRLIIAILCFLPAFILAQCSYDLNTTDKDYPCPCIDGFTCDTSRNVCIKKDTDLIKNMDATADATPDTGPDTTQNVGPDAGLVWAGVLSRPYGFDDYEDASFPPPEQWGSAINTMTGYFSEARPAATSIWLVGDFNSDNDNCGIDLGFPKPDDGNYYSKVYFSTDGDEHERFLNYFDNNDIQVYLGIEPGRANVEKLIDLVLSRYTIDQNHKSVIGLAIDVDWNYKCEKEDDEATPITDYQAEVWEKKVKSYNSNYRLVLRYYEYDTLLPPNYRGDIIFSCDTDENDSYEELLDNMKNFADYFYPNDVFFEIGYKSDYSWWKNLSSPIPETIGDDLASRITKQKFGVLWVDSTLKDPLINLLP